jgi:hypothetical protein
MKNVLLPGFLVLVLVTRCKSSTNHRLEENNSLVRWVAAKVGAKEWDNLSRLTLLGLLPDSA